MLLCATGSHARFIQYCRLHSLGSFNYACVLSLRLLSSTNIVRINVVKGANQTGKTLRNKERRAQARETFRDGDETGSDPEASSHVPEDGEGDGAPTIHKIEMRKPRHVAFSQSEQRRRVEEAGTDESAAEGLPLPPFMRAKKLSTRFDKWYKTGTYDWDQYEAQRAKESRAPFATAFAQNPYAQALATPLREDSFTHARLPKACILDLHLADDVESNKLKLLPLGLAAALLRNTDRKRSRDAKAIEQTDRKESAVKPEGTASYVILKKEALDYIGQDPKRRARRRAVGRRMNETLDKDQNGHKVEWRNDTAELVLKSLRRIVRNRLRDLMLQRSSADKRGVVTALKNMFGLNTLDDVDNVSCVVRLKPATTDEPPQTNRIPEPKNPLRSHFWPNVTSFLGDTYGEWDYETPAQRWERENTPQAGNDEPGRATQRRSATERYVLDHWSQQDLRGVPFLGHCLPLPAPNLQATWYYPTIRYRSQRVPIYNLPALLGADEMEKLLADTVFADVILATITQPWVSAELQIWLFKLQAFLAKSKEATEKA